MQLKISSKKILLVATFSGLVIFLTISFYSIPKIKIQNSPEKFIANVASSYTEKVSSGLPKRLKIPEINVDTALEYVGITSEGAVDAPKGPTNAAWLDVGPRPGDNGSAVITGHYGRWKNGQGSVFDDLDKLKKGDKLYIEDENGVTVTFVVRELLTYKPDAEAPDVFSSSDGKSHLNIITCSGVWDGIKKTYSNRLVVFADKE